MHESRAAIFSLVLIYLLSTLGCRNGDSDEKPDRRALVHFNQGNEFIVKGDLEAAANEFKKAQEYAPGWSEARENHEYCLRIIDPMSWSKTHPKDMDAWMRAFQQMIDSKLFKEAETLVERLPPGNDKKVFEDIIKAGRMRAEATK